MHRTPFAPFVVAAVFSMAAGAQTPPASQVPQRIGKARSSSTGTYAIRVVEEGSRCRIEALKDQAVSWSIPKCLARADDFVFISEAGDRFWVIRALPEIPKATKKQRGAPHFSAVVMSLHDKQGRLLKQRRLGDFLQKHRLGLIRSLDRHFKWLEGVYDVPGKGPRVNDKNQVELESVSGKTETLEFK